jgi:glycine cleavage system H protein
MAEIKFHKEHTWVRVEEDDIGVIGITDYAQDQLGKVIYVELPEEGDELTQGEEFGQIESSKATSDLIAPVSGEVLEANEALNDDPSIINDSPYEEGWIVKVKMSDLSELDSLMTQEEYDDMISKE